MTDHDPILDQRALRDALGCFATGVTIITTRTPEGRLEGLTANSFASVSLTPPLVLWSLDLSAASLEGFKTATHFAVSVLARHQRAIAHHFATTSADKFDGINWTAGLGGSPVLGDHLASFECRTERQIEGGDHIIFLGRVLRFSQRSGSPLVFSGGHYQTTQALPDMDNDHAAEDFGYH